MTGTYHATLESGLATRVARIRSRIDEAAKKSGRSGQDVCLIAICKTVTRASVNAAYAAGLRDFGENRVEQAIEKFAENVPPDLVLHMVGPLRAGELGKVAGRFGLVHSLDGEETIDILDSKAAIAGVVQPALLQVNVGREEQKHGCEVEDVPRVLEHALTKQNLDIQGFMTMAPYHAAPADTRPVFAEMREIAEQMRERFPEADIDVLSMGMTNDFSVAVEEGSTMVRVGRAIFHAEHAV